MPSAAPQPYTPRRAELRGRRRRHTWRNAILVVVGLLVVVLVFAGIYIGSIMSAFDDQRRTVDAGVTVEDDGVLNILLLGSDSRGEGEDVAENKGEDGERSDTMMLVHVPEDRQNVYVMSIVRDLWVEIPGHGERKINAALGLGGYPLVTRTVEQLLGVPIDHLAVIDFEGFNDLTQALGGVELCNPHAFSSGQVDPSFFPRGDILLQGSDALRYVRERQAFLGGDFERVENQQRFVRAVADQLLSVNTLANPQRVMDVVNAFAPFITVDEGLDAATIAGYALSLRGLSTEDIEMFTIPHGPPAEGPGGASIVEQDPEGMAELRRALATDNMDSFLPGDDPAGSDPAATDAAPTPESSPSPGTGSPDEAISPSAPAGTEPDAGPPADAGGPVGTGSATAEPSEPATAGAQNVCAGA